MVGSASYISEMQIEMQSIHRNDKVQYQGMFPGLQGLTGQVMANEPTALTHSWDCLVVITDNRGLTHCVAAHYYELVKI